MDIKTRSGNFSRIELDDRTREFWKVGQKGLRDGKEALHYYTRLKPWRNDPQGA